ncbi:MAG: maleylpyruvate isomerase family mycothiol-dependent enzyme [Acidimicrobiales bacterium]
MDAAAHLDALQREGSLLAGTAVGDLTLTVPSCPQWTVAQLVGHTGWVHRWVSATLRADPATPPSPKTIEAAPTGPDVLAWYRQALDEVILSLTEVDPARTYKTFAGPRDGYWWARRMAHEAGMHRWDAQNATGGAAPFDPVFAADGVEEALDTYVLLRFDHRAFESSGQTIHLHATDTPDTGGGHGGEWMLTMQPEAVVWERAHGKGDVALRGSTGDLLLFLMSRVGPDVFEVFGDRSLAERWQAAANF